jgi:hypothetical protein
VNLIPNRGWRPRLRSPGPASVNGGRIYRPSRDVHGSIDILRSGRTPKKIPAFSAEVPCLTQKIFADRYHVVPRLNNHLEQLIRIDRVSLTGLAANATNAKVSRSSLCVPYANTPTVALNATVEQILAVNRPVSVSHLELMV